jgi:hypothetical protein
VELRRRDWVETGEGGADGRMILGYVSNIYSEPSNTHHEENE